MTRYKIQETRYRKEEAGVSTIIIVVILSTVFVLMGFVFAFRGIARLEEAEIAFDGDRAEWAAESGADEALLQLRRDPNTYRGSNFTIESGVTATITVDAAGAIYTITSEGRSGDAVKTLVVELEDDSPAAGGYEGFHPKITRKSFK